MVIMAYVAINLAIVFTNVDTSSMGTLGHRFGWYVDSLTLLSPQCFRITAHGVHAG